MFRKYDVWKDARNDAWNRTTGVRSSRRCTVGSDTKTVLITISLIVVPVVIFCVFVARNLLHKFASYNSGYAVLVVTIVFTIYVLFLLLLTSARDPGIVPRASHPPQEETWEIPRTKEVIYKGIPVKVKYCETCMIFRPPRCSHCSVCNNCVERFDHHCPWVGNCIGLRNYRHFFMFVSSASLLCIFVFAMSAVYIKFLMNGDYPTVWKAMKHSPASVILMLYCFIFLWFVGGLTAFHSYLVSTNQTTYENFRYRADGRRNVFGSGCFSNCLEVFCTKVPPSRIKSRSTAQEEIPGAQHSLPGHVPELEDDSAADPRAKVEDDLELGGDLLTISQRRTYEDVDEGVEGGTTGNGLLPSSTAGPVEAASDSHISISRADVRISSRRRSASCEISPEILATSSSSVAEPYQTQRHTSM